MVEKKKNCCALFRLAPSFFVSFDNSPIQFRARSLLPFSLAKDANEAENRLSEIFKVSFGVDGDLFDEKLKSSFVVDTKNSFAVDECEKRFPSSSIKRFSGEKHSSLERSTWRLAWKVSAVSPGLTVLRFIINRCDGICMQNEVCLDEAWIPVDDNLSSLPPHALTTSPHPAWRFVWITNNDIG